MLVLSRKMNEHIIINDDIAVTVLRFTGASVRLGIRAPGDTRVLRLEISGPEAEIKPLEGDEIHKGDGMLVLSRRRDEAIRIGPWITITVVEVRGDKVRLGIEAPKEFPVHRNEVYAQVRGKQAWFLREADEGAIQLGA